MLGAEIGSDWKHSAPLEHDQKQSLHNTLAPSLVRTFQLKQLDFRAHSFFKSGEFQTFFTAKDNSLVFHFLLEPTRIQIASKPKKQSSTTLTLRGAFISCGPTPILATLHYLPPCCTNTEQPSRNHRSEICRRNFLFCKIMSSLFQFGLCRGASSICVAGFATFRSVFSPEVLVVTVR